MTPPRHGRHPTLGVLLVLAASLLFAVNGTVAKLAMQGGLDPAELTTLRVTGAFAGLVVLCLAVRPGIRRLAVTRRELPLLVTYGLTGYFLIPTLYFVAISRLPVGIGLLLEYTAPLFVALWVRFAQHQQVRPRLWVGLVASLVGLGCVAEVWGGIRLDGLGVAAGLTAAVLLAVYFLLGSRGASRRDPLSLNCWAFAFAALAGIAVRSWHAFPVEVLGQHSGGVPVWLLVGYVIVLGTIAPYLLITGGLRHLPPTSVGMVGMAEPVIASAVAWLVLAEALSAAQLAGGLLVLLGVGLAETARTAPAAEPPVMAAPDLVTVTGGTTTGRITTSGTNTGAGVEGPVHRPT